MESSPDLSTVLIDDPIVHKGELAHNEGGHHAETGFLDVLLLLAERKVLIAKFVLSSVIVAAIIAFVWPKKYTSTVKIMPPQQAQSSLASALMGQMGQLGPIASLAGNTLGIGKSNSDVYLYVLHSRTVADDLIDHFSLMRVYRDKKRVDAREDLSDNTEIVSGKEGGIKISVSDRDPQRAADIANGYVDELKELTQTLAVTEAGRRRIFFEHEVQQSMDELSKAELGMKKTQEETGILMLEPQSMAILQGLAGLHAQVAVKEAEVQAMRSFATDENPDLKRAESQLAALKSELSRVEAGKVGDSAADIDLRKIPEKGLAYVRAVRELKYREAVYEAMIKQYEIARVDEAKEAAIIQILDKALPPEKRTSPKRSLIVLSGGLLGLFLGVIFVLGTDRAKDDKHLAARLQLLKLRLLQHAD